MPLSPARRLERFSDYVSAGHQRPQRKMVRDLLFGIAASGSTNLSEMAGIMCRAEATAFAGIHRRLSEGLNNPRLDRELLWHRLRLRSLRHLRAGDGRGLVVALDLTSTEHRGAQKARGRGMWAVSRVWQGSQGRTALGHRYTLVQATTACGRRIPLALKVIDRTDPNWHSNRAEYMAALSEVLPLVGQAGNVVADRGFSGRLDFVEFDNRCVGHRGEPIPWTTRLTISLARKKKKKESEKRDEEDEAETVGKQKDPLLSRLHDQRTGGGMLLRSEDGQVALTREHTFEADKVATLMEQGAADARRGHGPRRVQIHARRVWVTRKDRPEEIEGPLRTLIAAFTAGRKSPRVLLHSRALHTPDEVVAVHRAYHDRWEAETVTRAVKSRFWGIGFEGAQVLTRRSIPAMAWAVAAYATFLDELQHAGPTARTPLLDLVHTTAEDPKDYRYRLARGLRLYLQRRIDDEARARGRTGEPWPPRRRAWMGMYLPLEAR